MIKKRTIIYLVLFIFATIFMGIGYASINNITLDISGNSSTKAYEGVRIKNITYLSNVDADIVNSKIDNFGNTVVNSTIVLGNNNNSTITYQITLENESDYDYQYIDTIYDNNFYDNNKITYTISGISANDIINSNSEKDITITFKYAGEDISTNTLNSYLNIKFSKLFTITYENITNNNYPVSITENGNTNITFINDIPDDVTVTGEVDSNYNNGVLTLNDVKSNIVITKVTTTSYLYTISGSHSIGDTVNPTDYSIDLNDVTSPYIKYKIDGNNQVIQIESCKKESINASSICLIGEDNTKYNVNKNNILSYFGGSISNIPSNCSEEQNLGVNEFSCSNSYVELKASDDGSVVINDKETSKICNIQPSLGIKSCN